MAVPKSLFYARCSGVREVLNAQETSICCEQPEGYSLDYTESFLLDRNFVRKVYLLILDKPPIRDAKTSAN